MSSCPAKTKVTCFSFPEAKSPEFLPRQFPQLDLWFVHPRITNRSRSNPHTVPRMLKDRIDLQTLHDCPGSAKISGTPNVWPRVKIAKIPLFGVLTVDS